jgi:hypothetical protein
MTAPGVQIADLRGKELPETDASTVAGGSDQRRQRGGGGSGNSDDLAHHWALPDYRRTLAAIVSPPLRQLSRKLNVKPERAGHRAMSRLCASRSCNMRINVAASAM